MFSIEKRHLNTLFTFDCRQSYQKLCIIKMLGWKLRRFYCYFNLSPKIIAWSLLEMKNLLGLLFLHTITHPYILEIWLDRKAGKKLQHKKSNFCCSVKYILNTSFCIHEDPIMPHLRIRFSPVL